MKNRTAGKNRVLNPGRVAQQRRGGLKLPTVIGTDFRDAAMVSAAALMAAWPTGAAADEGWPNGLATRTEPAWDGQLAQNSERIRFDIPAQPLTGALTSFGQQSGLQVTFDAAIAGGLRSQPLAGDYTADEALRILLSGTGILYRIDAPGTVVLSNTRSGDGALTLGTITVQGVAESDGFKANYQSSATKTALSIRETPQTITVTTRDSIDERQATDIHSALELTAGVATRGATNAGHTARLGESFKIRGQDLYSDRDLRMDGFSTASEQNNIDLVAVERIEVIKGPSSMLYGQGSIGGLINLVRKKPQDEFSANIVGKVGSFDTYRTEMDVTGPLDEGLPLRGRLVAAVEDSNAFIDGVESRRGVIAPSLEAEIGEHTRVLLQTLYQEDNFIPSQGIPLRREGTELKAPNISRSFYFGVPSTEDSKAWASHTSLQVDRDLDDRWLASLMLHGSYNYLRSISDAYGYGIKNAAGDTDVYSNRLQHQNNSWAGELRLDGRFDMFGQEHHVLAGLELNRLRLIVNDGTRDTGSDANIYANNFSSLSFPSAADNEITFKSNAVTKNKAAYGQLQVGVTESTKLLLGGRYDSANTVGRAESSGAELWDDNQTDQAWTFRVGLSQDITENITAFGSFAESFEPLGGYFSRTGILPPQTGEGYELGLKSEWFDGKLSATASVFQQELDNRPLSDPTNGPGDYFYVSGGLQRTRGAEMEISGSPYPGLTVGVAASLLESEHIDPLDPNFGLTPDGTVEQQGSLYVDYRLQQGRFRGLGFGGTIVAVGERTVLSNAQNLTAEGYQRVDLHASYEGIEGLDLSLNIRNLLDTTYIERVNSAFGYNHFFGSPRAFLLTAHKTF